MLKALRHPLPNAALLPASIAIVAAVALYCVAYTGLAGRSEPIGEAAAWAMINVLPWFLAFEAAKRASALGLKVMALAAALAASMLLHVLLAGLPAEPGFELVRRLPALLLVIGLLALGRLPAAAEAQQSREIPLLPRQIDWISAAGNYVELHGSGRTIVHRSSLSSVEADLAAHGFVRIHRSTLVRRDAVARVRPNDVLLADGTSLPTGKRYRSTLH
jgi:DNA-binding LytR/AlgR family response regulator